MTVLLIPQLNRKMWTATWSFVCAFGISHFKHFSWFECLSVSFLSSLNGFSYMQSPAELNSG